MLKSHQVRAGPAISFDGANEQGYVFIDINYPNPAAKLIHEIEALLNPEPNPELAHQQNEAVEEEFKKWQEVFSNRKIKLGLISAYEKRGELGRYVDHLLNAYAPLIIQDKLEVVLFAHKDGDKPVEEIKTINYILKDKDGEDKTVEVSVKIRRVTEYNNPLSVIRLVKAVVEEGVDIVNFQWLLTTPGNNLRSMFCATMPLFIKALGIPTTVTMHHTVHTTDWVASGRAVTPWEMFKLIARGETIERCFKYIDQVYVTLERMRKEYQEHYGIPAKVMPHAFFGLGNEPKAKDPRYAPDRTIFVGSLGSWGSYKRLEDNIAALRKLFEKYPQDNAIGLMAGGDKPNNPQGSVTERAVAEYQKSTDVLVIDNDEVDQAIDKGEIQLNDVDSYRNWLIAQAKKTGKKIIYRAGMSPQRQDKGILVSSYDIALQIYRASNGASGVAHEAASDGIVIVTAPLQLPQYDDVGDVMREAGIPMEIVSMIEGKEEGRPVRLPNPEEAAEKIHNFIQNPALRFQIAHQEWEVAKKLQPEDLGARYYQNYLRILTPRWASKIKPICVPSGKLSLTYLLLKITFSQFLPQLLKAIYPIKLKGITRRESENKEYRALALFDLDGTLGDERYGCGRTERFSEAFKEVYGVDTTIDSINYHGMTDQEIIIAVLRKAGLSDEEIMPKLDLCKKAIEASFKKSASHTEFRALGGVERLLSELERNHVLLGVATGNLEGVAREGLKKLGLKRYFKVGGFGSDATRRNELVRIAIERAEREFHFRFQDNIYLFGDAPQDVEAAKQLGIRAIGVATGSYKKEELAKFSPDYIFDDLTDAGKILQIIVRNPASNPMVVVPSEPGQKLNIGVTMGGTKIATAVVGPYGLIAVEKSVLPLYNSLAVRLREGTVGREEFVRGIEEKVLPPWRVQRGRFDNLKNVAAADAKLVANVRRYMQLRQESWECAAEAVLHEDPERMKQHQQKWEAAEALVRDVAAEKSR